jgi:hypothetical protein
LIADACSASPVLGFVRSRWQGDVSLHRLFWWDTLAVATLINACVAMFSMILLARGMADGSFWFLLHLILLPYNLFLVIAVWRHEKSQDILRLATLVWLALTLIT